MLTLNARVGDEDGFLETRPLNDVLTAIYYLPFAVPVQVKTSIDYGFATLEENVHLIAVCFLSEDDH